MDEVNGAVRDLIADLSPGQRLHIWLASNADGTPGRMRIGLNGRAVFSAESDSAAGPAFFEFICEKGGPHLLDWSDSAAVHLIYRYDPRTVLRDGIKVLRQSAAMTLAPDGDGIHLRPPFGWMNDPNGFCAVEGGYHLFYQHHPFSQRWGDMHWGHAYSRDLVTWTHLPVFLRPEAHIVRSGAIKGGCFSGSVRDFRGQLQAFYTIDDSSHSPRERQAVAVSPDWLHVATTDTIIADPPPIAGTSGDIRDPYFVEGPDGAPLLLIGTHSRTESIVALYTGSDPSGQGGWTYAGMLFSSTQWSGACAECPSLVCVDQERGLWALTISILNSRDPETRRKNLSYVIVGRFDGRDFVPLHQQELDVGTDCYAFQAIATSQGPVGIGWAANWSDFRKDRDFPTSMTLPRRLIWDGTRILTPPINAVRSLRQILQARRTGARETFDIGAPAFELLTARAEATGPFRLALDFGGRSVDFSYAQGVACLDYTRNAPGAGAEYRVSLPCLETVRLFWDAGLLELFLNDGEKVISKRLPVFSADRAVTVQVESGGGLETLAWTLGIDRWRERPHDGDEPLRNPGRS